MTTNVRGLFKDEFNEGHVAQQLLRRELNSLQSQSASVGQAVVTRLARVTNVPTPGDNIYDIIFLDGSFDTAGAPTSTATYTDRQSTASYKCYNVSNVDSNQGDVIIVHKIRNRWWTY